MKVGCLVDQTLLNLKKCQLKSYMIVRYLVHLLLEATYVIFGNLPLKQLTTKLGIIW